jgi:hypothetical protein
MSLRFFALRDIIFMTCVYYYIFIYFTVIFTVFLPLFYRNFTVTFRILLINEIACKPLYNTAINDRASLNKGQPRLRNFNWKLLG